MKIVELILDENEDLTGIEAISIVENPAIEEDFIALKSEHDIKLAEVDKEKKILLGALLIPNKPIYRRSGKEEYYIYFSRDTVRKASQIYLQKGNQKQFNFRTSTFNTGPYFGRILDSRRSRKRQIKIIWP